jgi:hypothetical protein
MRPGDDSCRVLQGKTYDNEFGGLNERLAAFASLDRKPEPTMLSPKGHKFDTPGVYRIRVQGFLDECWSARLNGVEILVQDLPDEAPVTLLTGRFVDQAALAGVLTTLYDLGYPLLSVELLEAQPLAPV